MNFLGPKFETYVTVLNKKACNKKVLTDLDTLLKNLEEKEICIAEKSLLNNFQTNFSVRSFKSNPNGQSCSNQKRRVSQEKQSGQDRARSGSNTADYSNATCYCY